MRLFEILRDFAVDVMRAVRQTVAVRHDYVGTALQPRISRPAGK